jgi:hypothetical protein
MSARLTRRNFLGALAAPLLVRPTLEEIERLTWRRKYFAGWSPLAGLGLELGDVLTIEHRFAVNPQTGAELPYLQHFVVSKITRAGCAIYPAPGGRVRASDVRPLLTGRTLGVYQQTGLVKGS